MNGERSRERIGRARQRAEERISQRYVLSQGAGCGVGTAGIAIGKFDLPEVFYALLPKGGGRGAATVAAVALSDWVLSLGLGPVLLFTMIGNTTSEAVAARAGFTCAGQVVLDHRASPLLHAGGPALRPTDQASAARGSAEPLSGAQQVTACALRSCPSRPVRLVSRSGGSCGTRSLAVSLP